MTRGATNIKDQWTLSLSPLGPECCHYSRRILTHVTEFGNRTRHKAYSNIKILLYHWLLIYVHVSKPTGGRRPCDIKCSKFFPAPFWSYNQKVVWVSLLYLHTKSNADYLPINSTLILSHSLGSDHETTRLRYQGLCELLA